MTDYLAQWLSDNPGLIAQIKRDRTLEQYLRKTKPSDTKKGVSDAEWDRIVTRLRQQ